VTHGLDGTISVTKMYDMACPVVRCGVQLGEYGFHESVTVYDTLMRVLGKVAPCRRVVQTIQETSKTCLDAQNRSCGSMVLEW
jgi:hypothetical protein